MSRRKLHNKFLMSCSFVLGNGTSRIGVDLNTLRLNGKIYGCNALYRDYDPDYLVAVDPKMIFELQESKYQLHYNVWTNLSKNHQYDDGFNYFTPTIRWSSGPCALHLASTHKPDYIYILGFDFVGIDEKFNNVYADTFNYKSSKEIPTYWGNWESQTETVIKTNPSIQYIRVIRDTDYQPTWQYNNFKNLKYSEFNSFITSA